MTWTAAKIRKTFLDFFVAKGHEQVRSSPLIPGNDPTLFFTNAGMVQFKDVFVGARQLGYDRATTVQKCLRVSGKHNDLENVGRTARHHTFFEMLGNFSFGDYFKEDAIRYAWELLTEVFKLPKDKLYISVHPEDEEAYQFWHQEIGIPEERLYRDPENFWQMGEIGPCGPCSELYIDLGPSMSDGKEVAFGDPAGDDRYLELWNLVFMQFERTFGPDGEIEERPLPRPSVDTGAGLERLVAVLQGKFNNFDTDVFLPIIDYVAKRAQISYHANPDTDVALRVIADHTRATTALIADGVYPDNEGRGYVLRRIMRRAIRFGRMIGLEGPFLVNTCDICVEELGEVYPELREARETIQRIVLQEEQRFGRTIKAGLKLLEDEADAVLEKGGKILDGEVAFTLYDTHGFPPDLTGLILEEKGLSYDAEGYEAAMEAQRERARAASQFKTINKAAYQALAEAGIADTVFLGYEHERAEAQVLAILVDGTRVPQAAAGQTVEIVTNQTPLYAEAGGQVGDLGYLERAGAGVKATITDVQTPFGGIYVHVTYVDEGVLREGDRVVLTVDHEAREQTRKNHSATHLMHDALRQVLGEHVRQRGSLVAPHRLRFDFSHTAPMTSEEIAQVELLVNRQIIANGAVETESLAYDDAIAKGAIAFFDEKYGDKVRVLSMGEQSVELCGGTHVRHTGDIGLFKIISEGPISSGVRRIEALTGMDAVEYVMQRTALIQNLATELRTKAEEVPERVQMLLDERKSLQTELGKARLEWQKAKILADLPEPVRIGEHEFTVIQMDGIDGKEIRAVAESLRSRLQSGALLVLGQHEGKVSLVVTTSANLVKTFPAGKAVSTLAKLVGGGGGGRPDFAQAGGSEPGGMKQAVDTFYELARQALS